MKNVRRTDYRDAKLAFICAGGAQRSNYKANTNINKQINIVTMFVSRITEMIKLIHNQLDKNEPSGWCP